MARRMKKPLLILAVGIGFWLFAFSAIEATILNASIVNTADANTNVYYYTTGEAYLDLLGGNPELRARVCSDNPGELNNKYVTFVYKAGNRSDYKIIAQEGGTGDDMVQFTGCGATKCCSSPNNLDFKDTGAYYPAYVYAVVSADNAVSTDDTFIWVPTTGGWLQGSYTTNSVSSSYDQVIGNITLTVSAVTGTTNTGSYTITKDTSFLVEAICSAVSELQAFNCSSSMITDPGTTVKMFTGVTKPADTSTTTKYYLINGINNSFCIGPDLTVTSVSLSSSSAYSGQSITATANIQNAGNVNVTQNFTIGFYRDGINFANSTNITGLVNSTSTSKSVTLDTTGFTSGSKTILARILDKSNNAASTVEDCNNLNDNSSTTLTVQNAYSLAIYINSSLTSNFTTPGIPYNISIIVTDSDSSSCTNLTLKITERNGLNLFAPTQGYTIDNIRRGVSSYSIAEIYTNSTGGAAFALIPTGNKLYLPEYSYLNVTSYVGNYSLYIELFNGTTELQLSQSGALLDQYNLTLLSHTPVQPTSAQQNALYVTNQNSFIASIVSFFNQAYSNVYKWLGT